MKAKAVALPCVTLIAVARNKMSCLGPFVFMQILSYQGGFFTQKGCMFCGLNAELV